MMATALSIFTGHTQHRRTEPFGHAFRYNLAFVRLDLDRLEDAARASRFFSIGRFNLFSFFPRDHGARDGSDLAAWARHQFSDAGLDVPQDCVITLLCQPRVLGYQFNPISVFQAQDRDGRILGAIYEVHNTFGDAHAYVAVFGDAGPVAHGADKRLHVSPFYDMSGRYQFDLRSGAGLFSLVIAKSDGGGPDFTATMVMREQPATNAGFVGLFRNQPFSTFKTITAIHWQALRIWIKGGRYHPRPAPPIPAATRIHLGQKPVSS